MAKTLKNNLKICFIGGKQAGILGVLALLSKGHEVLSAVSYSEDLTNILSVMNICLHKSVYDIDFIDQIKQSDLLVCVHGREILCSELLRLPKIFCVNVHPYLYRYKGQDPVARALRDKEFKASVGAHIMTEKIDGGEVLAEEFTDVSGSSSEEEIYNRLYPYYVTVIFKTLKIAESKKNEI
jgi:methionyl-tRNA formyltransferase